MGLSEAASDGSDIALRAKRGVLLLTGRGFLLRLLGLLSTVVLTRFLNPREFGVLAIGTTAVGFSNLLNDAGVGAALLRRRDAPTAVELRGMVSIQFGLTSAIWLVALAVAIVSRSPIATVTAIMLLALPLSSLKTPAFVLLERQMTYGPLIRAEFAEWLLYSAVALTSVVLGAGVWGVAAATVVKLVAGIAILWSTVPGAVALPTRRVAPVRPMLRFGVQFQAVDIVTAIRDQGLNLLVVAVGGLSVLGLWSIAGRVLLVVGVVLESLWRVSFPGMARILETKSDPSQIIGRTVSMVALGLGVVLVAVVTFGPHGVPLVFGREWRAAADVLPWACLGYAVAGPVSTACAGYLYARGDARTILVSTILHTIVNLGTVALLLPEVGLAALGLGLVGSSIVDLVLLRRATLRTIRAPLLAPTATLVLTASLASAIGLAVGGELGDTLPAVAAGVFAGLIAYAGLFTVTNQWVVPDRLRLDLGMLARQMSVATRGR